jgi:DNA-binding NtrC family response regulator
MPVFGRRLLVVEDEPLLRVSIADALRKEGWTVDVAEDGSKGEALFDRHLHDLVLTDLVMPQKGGLELLRHVKRKNPDTNVIIITAHGTVERAVEAMRDGATDFITKPFSMAQLFVRLDSVHSVRMLREQNTRLQAQLEERYSYAKLIGKSAKMREVFDLISVVAESDASVVIHGDSGTGKELVASAVHYNSSRRAGPYVRVSCASLPESLIEAELFGYEKGAFTGANQRRIGRFEAASGGTLFLDEIGDLPQSFQVKLLRVLQEKQIERLGSNDPIDIDVRIVTASLRPLEEEIRLGRFREDLYFRLNTVTVTLPPLSQRREDVPLLANHFLREFANAQDKQIERFSDEVLSIFDSYGWPGNVRELRNVIERAVLFCNRPIVTIDDLPTGLRSSGPMDSASLERAQGGGDDEVVTLASAIEKAEIRAIRAALASTGGRRTEAAKALGISRKTLWEKVKNYDISV